MGKTVVREYLFGISPCLAALLTKRREIFNLILSDSLQRTKNLRPELQNIISLAEDLKGCTIKYKSVNVMDRLSGNRPHQKVLLDTRTLEYADGSKLAQLTDVPKRKDQKRKPFFFLALDQVQDPMNFGAVLRSALYFGVDAVVASKEHSCKLSPVVSKASSGAMEWLPVYNVTDLPRYLMKQRKANWDVIGSISSSGNERDLGDKRISNLADFSATENDTILVIGNEGAGMRADVFSACNILTTILPRKKLDPGMESLNLSVATGILLHSLLQSRKEQEVSCPLEI